jgi:hypothetical protein
MVAAIYWDNSSHPTITAPTGWTLIREDTNTSSNQDVALYYRAASASEPSSYTWSANANIGFTGIISAYACVDTIAPIDAHAGETGSSGDPVAPSITTTSANDWLIGVWSSWNNNVTLTAPSGMTARRMLSGSDPMTLADQPLGSPGPSGTRTATASGETRFWTGQAVALRTSTTGSANKISFRGVSGGDTNGSALTISRPAGVQANDVLIAAVYWDNTSQPAITPPAGWTLVRQDGSTSFEEVAVYSHVAGASEPGSYAWGSSSSVGFTGIISAYSGVNTISPIDVTGGQTGTTPNPVAPSVTSTSANAQLIAIWSAWNAGLSLTAPSGMTTRLSFTGSDPITLADKSLASIGPTGAQTSTSSGSPGFWTAQSIALRPAP